jgi:phosphoribosyl 1,2-cyclic phosphate phosphodiesterase
LILDCVQRKPHRTHLYLESALALAAKIGAQTTYLTHLGHDFDYRPGRNERLPKGIKLAYDGLTVKGEY